MTISAVIASGVVTTRYIVGQEVALATTVAVAGVATDPTGITLTITPVTADTTAVVVAMAGLTHPGVGQFGYVYTIPAAGHYQWTWVTTDVGKGVHSGWFDATDATPPLMTMADARDAINRTARPMSDRDTAELQLFVDAVNGWVFRRCGPVVPQLVTETLDYGPGGFRVPSGNRVLSPVSASWSGNVLDVTGWARAGRSWIAVPAPGTAAPGGAAVLVVYVAGWSPVPADVQLAARILLEHLWETQRTQSAAPSAYGADEVISVSGYGYAIPNRVSTLIAPYERGIVTA